MLFLYGVVILTLGLDLGSTADLPAPASAVSTEVDMLRTNLVYICFWLAILAGAAPKPADGSSPSAPQPGDAQDAHSSHLGSLQVARLRSVAEQQHSVPKRHASTPPAPQAVSTVQLQQQVAGSPVGRRPRSLPNFHTTRKLALLGYVERRVTRRTAPAAAWDLILTPQESAHVKFRVCNVHVTRCNNKILRYAVQLACQ